MVLLPVSCRRTLIDLFEDVAPRVRSLFYLDAADALRKALNSHSRTTGFNPDQGSQIPFRRNLHGTYSIGTLARRPGERLSYLPYLSPELVEPRGIEPLTFALRTRRSPS